MTSLGENTAVRPRVARSEMTASWAAMKFFTTRMTSARTSIDRRWSPITPPIQSGNTDPHRGWKRSLP